jgi:hypothetical protein
MAALAQGGDLTKVVVSDMGSGILGQPLDQTREFSGIVADHAGKLCGTMLPVAWISDAGENIR